MKVINNFLKMQNCQAFDIFHNKCLIDIPDLVVPAVDSLAVVGTSGSGKTTFIKTILGLVKHSGSVDLLDNKITTENNTFFYKGLGVLFQKAALFNDLSVINNCFFAQELGFNHVRDLSRVEYVLKKLNLWEARKKLPSELSGGMQHRAGLARVLCRQNECLILDEPTTGQDNENAAIIADIIKEYQEEFKSRLILVSHDYDWLRPLIHWSILLHNGCVSYSGKDLKSMRSKQEVV